MPIIEGTYITLQTNAGAPVAGTDEVQTITVTGTPTGGSFRLAFEGLRTASIAYNADAAAVDTALEALGSIGAGNVTVAGGPLPGAAVTVTFTGNLGKKAIGSLIALYSNSLTGGTNPTVTIAETTAGVNATFRGLGKGTLVIDTTNAKLYANTGTALAPTYVVVGTQT